MKKITIIIGLLLIVYSLDFIKLKKEKQYCTDKNPNGCFSLAVLYDADGPSHNSNKAINFYSKACSFNHAESCAILGAVYALGVDKKQNYNKSKIFYSKACSIKKSKFGCAGLGLLYEQGTGVNQSYKEAIKFYNIKKLVKMMKLWAVII